MIKGPVLRPNQCIDLLECLNLSQVQLDTNDSGNQTIADEEREGVVSKSRAFDIATPSGRIVRFSRRLLE